MAIEDGRAMELAGIVVEKLAGETPKVGVILLLTQDEGDGELDITMSSNLQLYDVGHTLWVQLGHIREMLKGRTKGPLQ